MKDGSKLFQTYLYILHVMRFAHFLQSTDCGTLAFLSPLWDLALSVRPAKLVQMTRGSEIDAWVFKPYQLASSSSESSESSDFFFLFFFLVCFSSSFSCHLILLLLILLPQTLHLCSFFSFWTLVLLSDQDCAQRSDHRSFQQPPRSNHQRRPSYFLHPRDAKCAPFP